MSSFPIQTMLFTQIIAFKSYFDNLGKPLNSTLNQLFNIGWLTPRLGHISLKFLGQSRVRYFLGILWMLISPIFLQNQKKIRRKKCWKNCVLLDFFSVLPGTTQTTEAETTQMETTQADTTEALTTTSGPTCPAQFTYIGNGCFYYSTTTTMNRAAADLHCQDIAANVHLGVFIDVNVRTMLRTSNIMSIVLYLSLC